MGCCQKGCPHTYHYACAVDTGEPGHGDGARGSEHSLTRLQGQGWARGSLACQHGGGSTGGCHKLVWPLLSPSHKRCGWRVAVDQGDT